MLNRHLAASNHHPEHVVEVMVDAGYQAGDICNRHGWARIRPFVIALKPFNGYRVCRIGGPLPYDVSVISIGAGVKADYVAAIGLKVCLKEVNECANARVNAFDNQFRWYIAHAKLPLKKPPEGGLSWYLFESGCQFVISARFNRAP